MDWINPSCCDDDVLPTSTNERVHHTSVPPRFHTASGGGVGGVVIPHKRHSVLRG